MKSIDIQSDIILHQFSKNKMYVTPSAIYMQLPDLQFWFGIFLFFAGISLHRIGPSFKRNMFGIPIFLIGFLLFLIPSGDLSTIEKELYSIAIVNIPWILTMFLGLSLSLYGAPIFWKRKLNINIFGILVLSLSWILYFYTAFSTNLKIINILANLFGMFIAFLILILIIKSIESNTPKVKESEPLDENEKKFIISIIKRNIGGE